MMLDIKSGSKGLEMVIDSESNQSIPNQWYNCTGIVGIEAEKTGSIYYLINVFNPHGTKNSQWHLVQLSVISFLLHQ